MNLFELDSLPAMLRDAITSRNLAARQILFRRDDAASALFFVKTGRLKVIRHTSESSKLTLQIARPGECLAEGALFSRIYGCEAIAEITSEVLIYPKGPLLSALRNYPDLAEDFMTRLVKQNQSLIMNLELRDIRMAHKRVLQYLRYLAGSNHASVVQFDRHLKDIAIDLGLTPETLSRALTRLEHEGVITRGPSFITLHNLPAA
jgi:CRP-like cAMP-binding protein